MAMIGSLFRSAKVIGVALAAALVVHVGVRVYGPVKGAYWRAFRTPPILCEQGVEDLVSGRAGEQRKRVVEVWRSGQGTYGLRQTVLSAEGTPIGLALVTEQGKATLVLDYTGDAYGPRRFIVQPVQAMELAFSAEQGGSGAVGGLRIRCAFVSGEPAWF
jgi:hypothetical protein